MSEKAKTIAELERERERAERARAAAAEARNEAKRAEQREIDEAEQAIMAKHAPLIEAAELEFSAANKAWREACDAVARAQAEAWPIVGKIYVEWKSQRYRYSREERSKQPTGKRAIVGVWTSGSPSPENVYHGLPSIGDLYLRVLKKDGTPSTRFERLFSYWGDEPEGAEERFARRLERADWYPEGVDPNRPKADEKLARAAAEGAL